MTGVGELADIRVASLLDLDPDLGIEIPATEWANARRATASHTVSLPAGDDATFFELGRHPGVSGILITDGLVLREVAVEDKALPELLGPGDVVEPTVRQTTFLPVHVRITTLAPTHVAVLGPSFARAAGHWPSLLVEVERRRSAARQRIAVHGAISQLGRVEVRLMALLWHLADTWGRITPDGVVIPFTLTHEMLGVFVGAERPTVTLAVGQLSEQGLLDRAGDRAWILAQGSDDWLHAELRSIGTAPSPVARARQLRRISLEHRAEARATRAESQQMRSQKHLHAAPRAGDPPDSAA